MATPKHAIDQQERRHRSSTTKGNALPQDFRVGVLTSILQILARSSIEDAIDTQLQRLISLFSDDQGINIVQDHFRRRHGFQALIRLLQSISLNLNTEEIETSSLSRTVDNCCAVLDLLAFALRGHDGNKRYFLTRIPSGGWSIVHDSVLSCYDLITAHSGSESSAQSLAGSLQALALDRSRPLDMLNLTSEPNDPAMATLCIEDTPTSGQALHNPHAFATLAALYTRWKEAWVSTRNEVFLAINRIISVSVANRISLRPTRTFTILAKALILSTSSETTVTDGSLFKLCDLLLQEGTSGLEDARLLYQHATESLWAQQLLSNAAAQVPKPASIRFDLSKLGHGALEISSLHKAFPPPTGYTLTLWFCLDQLDRTCHTTLFGAFDSGQTCFVLVYLEKDTRQLILQTSVKSSRPSVRFKRTVFEPGQWYHIALVQKGSEAGHCGQALLYVNGRLAEKRDDPLYPMPPAFVHSDTAHPSQSSSASTKRKAVQCFVGTPHELAENVKNVRWSLASARLYDVCLAAEIVAVHHGVGPCYMGSFQDSVGQWLKYRSSATLNRFNEHINRDRPEHSALLKAITSRGIYTLPEGNCLLSLTAQSVMGIDGKFTGTLELSPLLPNDASSRLHTLTRSGNAMVFNAARPALCDSVLRSSGIAALTGSATFDNPQSLSNATWRLGGFLAIHVRLLDATKTPHSLKVTIETLLQSIQENWRASEAVEKHRGYGIIALIIRKKLGFGCSHTSSLSYRVSGVAADADEQRELELSILHMLLAFVGYDAKDPTNSLLINPIAYRHLLVENGTWEMAGVDAQKLYYENFGFFLGANANKEFNAKRFALMRLIKMVVESLKMEAAHEQCHSQRLEAFRAIFSACASPRDHLEVTAFIVYALENQENQKLQRRQSLRRNGSRQRSSSSASTTVAFRSQTQAQSKISIHEVAVQVLRIYSTILCGPNATVLFSRFTSTVSPTWLICLLDQDDPRIVEAGVQLLTKIFSTAETQYQRELENKHVIFAAMKSQLGPHWRLPKVWLGCFAVLFGVDVGFDKASEEVTLATLVETFEQENLSVIHANAFQSIVSLLHAALEFTTSEQYSATAEQASAIRLVTAIADYLAQLRTNVSSFRQFADGQKYIEELVSILYPAVTNADRLGAGVELSFESSNVPEDLVKTRLRSSSTALMQRAGILRSKSSTTTLKDQKSKQITGGQKTVVPSITIDTTNVPTSPTEKHLAAHLSPAMPLTKEINIGLKPENGAIKSLISIVVDMLIDQVCNRKDFTGFGLFQKVPPGHQEHQSIFETYILERTMTQLWQHLERDTELLQSPRTLNNLARYSLHMAEAVFEGWFVDGGQPLVNFTGHVLDFLQQPQVAEAKDVRLCSRAITTIRTVFLRITLLRLSELDLQDSDDETLRFLSQLNYWQTILFAPDNQELPFIRLICYILYTKLTANSSEVRMASANLFRMLLVHKPAEAAIVLIQGAEAEDRHLPTGLMRLATHDDEELLRWVEEHRGELDAYLLHTLVRHWEEFVATENRKTEDTAKNRSAKRRERLKQWQTDEAEDEYTLHRLANTIRHWKLNCHGSEKLKLQRSLQDQHESVIHMHSLISRMYDALRQPCGLEAAITPTKWQLDQTEGRDRMRMRLSRDSKQDLVTYRPKRKQSQRIIPEVPQSNAALAPSSPTRSVSPGSDHMERPRSATLQTPSIDANGPMEQSDLSSSSLLEGEFELVEDPHDDVGGFEDKNRKVLRSLSPGDQIRQVFNVSRLVGLEACGSLLVIGKKNLYLQDGMFERSDHEIVSMAQAPSHERDHYIQLISGREISTQTATPAGESAEPKVWSWTDVLSLSKRRFLFREVAIEVFFMDGRSYLLILISPAIRDKVYAEMSNRAPHVHGVLTSPIEAEGWRLDSLRVPEDTPRSLGSRFANVFNAVVPDTPMRKWARGELSNFNYLMMINTMAGRTFNDLTQYPVFPWVLADYTSDNLDLTNARSFRDFSKPMGCQTPAREAEFRDRYHSFADMGEEKPFHYGTHYSSAMIVTSYLIRLQPFVQSYLLLQGGAFDHADRLFDSIGKAWVSASRQNMTDVRELTPEFYYLPEFLTNINAYNFGQKDGNSKAINHVELPPWAKGDPHVFIAKNREALESPYVSENLHLWIDLIFGSKQLGDNAIEATNVFHPLSYHGAKDLDAIKDPIERLSTIGIIHNFGQTPQQVFTKPHSARELQKHATFRLDTLSESLTKLPHPVLSSRERASSLVFSNGLDRVISSPPYRLYLPPNSRQYCQWLYADNSLRFFSTESKRLLNVYEELHIGPIVTAVFSDSRTLITAGTDSTIGIWDVESTPGTVKISSQTYLFGHRTPITHLAASRAQSLIVSSSSDGQVMTWDLNNHDCIRIMRPIGSPPVSGLRINNVTGHIALSHSATVDLYTVNGHLLLSQRLADSTAQPQNPLAASTSTSSLGAADSDPLITQDRLEQPSQDDITALAFYEGEGNEYMERTLLFTGHLRGLAKVWSLVTLDDGTWYLQLLKHLEHPDPVLEAAANHHHHHEQLGGQWVPAITGILPLAKRVYCGDESGRVWQWDCVLRQGRR